MSKLKETLPLYADDVVRMINAIERSGQKKHIRLRTNLDYPFGEVWNIDRAIRACRHNRPRRTRACWNCWRRAIRSTGDSILILVSRVRSQR